MHTKTYQWIWQLRNRQYRRRVIRTRQELEANETLTVEQIQSLQWQHLTKLIAYAYENVPYYRRSFDQAGINPADITNWDAWRQLPVLTRQDIQNNIDALVAVNCNKNLLQRDATGGSTGTPMAFYLDSTHRAYAEAGKLRFRAWSGFEMGDKVAMIWGAARDLPGRNWRERFQIYFLKRERWLNSFKLTAEKMEQFARMLVRWQPKYIVAYASSVYIFASFLKEKGYAGRIRPLAIETSADKLWDYRRQVVEEVFLCPVVDFYGSREIADIAGQCAEHNGLHVFSDLVYLEVLNDGRPALPGDPGEVIVTNLHNYAMPLIRYQNGDLARVSSTHECSCGRPFPMIEEIVGRMADAISTPNGQIVYSGFFNHLFYPMSAVKRYQVYQETLDKLEIKIEADQLISESVLQEIHNKVVAHLGPGITVTLKNVDEIPPTPTGKYRYVISKVPLPFVSQ